MKITETFANTESSTPETNDIPEVITNTDRAHIKPQQSKLLKLEGTTQIGISRDSSIHTVDKVEKMPQYPGGLEAFYKWVSREFKFPKAARDAGVSGRMTISFIVEKDGALTNIKILKDLGHGTGEEARRMLLTSEKWNPGMQNGKPVRVQYTLPLMLQVASDKKNSIDKKSATMPNQNDNPLFRAGINPKILIDGKKIQKEIPPGFNFGTATEAEYAELLGIKSSDIRSIAVTKSQDGSIGGTLSITTKDGVLEEEVVLEKADVSKVLSVRINGSSLKEKPLYILNGKEITSEQFQNIPPSSIDAISILKDSEATAIYGKKGENGVIIVTSKK